MYVHKASFNICIYPFGYVKHMPNANHTISSDWSAFPRSSDLFSPFTSKLWNPAM